MVKVEQDLQFLLEYSIQTLTAVVDLNSGSGRTGELNQIDGTEPARSDYPFVREIQGQPLNLLPTESPHGFNFLVRLIQTGARLTVADMLYDDDAITPASQSDPEEPEETHEEQQDENDKRDGESYHDSGFTNCVGSGFKRERRWSGAGGWRVGRNAEGVMGRESE